MIETDQLKSCHAEAPLCEGSSTRCVMLLLHVDTSPEYHRFVTCSGGTLFLAGVFGVDGIFPLWLHSSISDSLEIRNNVLTLFRISQINVAYLTIQLPCPNSRS